jgi:WD40 repeat protein
VLYLWSVFTRDDLQELSAGEGESITFHKWSSNYAVLAAGTSKGSLIFYNKKTKKKQAIVMKHSKEVVDGDWNLEGNLGNTDFIPSHGRKG